MAGRWYIQIERSTMDLEYMEPIVIGYFLKEETATRHLDSADVDDWCMGEAKAKKYIVEDCFLTQNPDIPSYGINRPIR
jgi:hypothetical protein